MPATPSPGPRPDGSPRRQAIEARSAVALLYLRSLPRVLPALLVTAVAAVGLGVPGPLGALALALVLLALGWLAYLSWPALGSGARAVRVVALGIIAAAVVSRLT